MCGYGDVGKGCAFDFRYYGARVFVADCDPNCAVHAYIEDLQVAPIESVASEIDIFVSFDKVNSTSSLETT